MEGKQIKFARVMWRDWMLLTSVVILTVGQDGFGKSDVRIEVVLMF